VAPAQAIPRIGVRFVSPTVCYAFMQAVGLDNSHVVSCFRFKELGGLKIADALQRCPSHG
jgi:DNA-3-methyladenine glycosylase I